MMVLWAVIPAAFIFLGGRVWHSPQWLWGSLPPHRTGALLKPNERLNESKHGAKNLTVVIVTLCTTRIPDSSRSTASQQLAAFVIKLMKGYFSVSNMHCAQVVSTAPFSGPQNWRKRGRDPHQIKRRQAVGMGWLGRPDEVPPPHKSTSDGNNRWR